MHRKYSRWPQGSESIPEQKKSPPKSARILLAQLSGLSSQALKCAIKELPCFSACLGQQPKRQLRLPGSNIGDECLNERLYYVS